MAVDHGRITPVNNPGKATTFDIYMVVHEVAVNEDTVERAKTGEISADPGYQVTRKRTPAGCRNYVGDRQFCLRHIPDRLQRVYATDLTTQINSECSQLRG